nr:TIR domain-containing protein [Actinoplanes polyasparticus]
MVPLAETGHVFVSYSRRQFHAARQLTAALHGHGIDAWFDVQRLVPGTD